MELKELKVFIQDDELSLNFNKEPWLRKQIISIDNDGKKQIKHGKRFKSFKDFLRIGDIILLKRSTYRSKKIKSSKCVCTLQN